VLTILAADVVDYSKLTEVAEETTHARLRAHRVRTINPCTVSYRGHIIKNTGDGFLASFDSPGDALKCALEIQREVTVGESDEPHERRIRFRMALNIGDVIVEPDDIYGHSVNVAARLEQYAPPGGIVVSEDFLTRVKSNIEVPLDDLGRLRLKNLSRRVHAYSLHIPHAEHDLATGAQRRPSRRTKIPSIAILPFRTSGENQEDAYFGAGMVDDIIVTLASITGLLVISRTSTLSYATGPTDIQKIGQELGVGYVLSGSVRRTGNRLRISSNLADVETNSVIWADRFDGNLMELFDLQDRIATRIVWSVAPHVREAELKRARRKRPENMTAYDLVLQAVDLIYRMNHADFVRAGPLLQRAIEADDGYATAYAYSALWKIHNINQGWTTNQKVDAEEALRLAAAAIDRDPADGFALAVYGHGTSQQLRDYRAGMELFDRALAAAPGNAMVWTLSSGVYSYMGNGSAAIERAEKGLRLSPVDRQSFFYLLFLTLAHYVNGTFEESVIWGRKSMSLNPRLCSNHRWLIGSLVALGQTNEAREIAQVLLNVQPLFRLSAYAQWCPLQLDLRTQLCERLRLAGVPD
jgi:TolB-like protein/class 3 adenylate cyclase